LAAKRVASKMVVHRRMSESKDLVFIVSSIRYKN